MTYRRFRRSFEAEQIFVVSNENYKDIVLEQIPELYESNLLLEPNPRNTACAIAYATKHIHARYPGSVVAISPSDHLVMREDVFIERIDQACDYAEQHNQIVTLGIKPTYAEVGYGYIQADECETRVGDLEEGAFYPVKTFIEKPNSEMARILVESGEFYWNAGLFVARTDTLLGEFEQHATEIYERLFSEKGVWGTEKEFAYVQETYPYCPSISFDYAVMEKTQNVVMLTSDMGWSDVGTWSAIYQLAEKDINANATVGGANHIFNDSKGNMIFVDDPEQLVVLQGVDDVLVVQRDGVLLLCRRGDEHKLKQVVPEAQSISDKYVD